jgi:TolB-like protein/Tfp pilus assembly protein PilF
LPDLTEGNKLTRIFMQRFDTPDDGASPVPEGTPLPDRKLESWKEIADFLDREVRTVQRWEEFEGLPVRRHEHRKGSTVYAYTVELDEWRKNRQPKDDPEADDVFERAMKASEAAADDDNNAVEPPPPQPTPPVVPHSRAAWKRVVVVALGVLSAAWYGVYSLWQPRPLTRGKARLVVLPFTNLSADPNQDYFSAGLTDEMITRLGRLDPQHLGVIAPASSSAVAGMPISQIGRTLDVQYALEGTVRRAGNRVRIDVQLIQVSDQTHLWTDSYDRDLDDILGVQDDVGAKIASQIRLALNPSATTGSATSTKRTVDPDVYDAYLRGRFYWTNRADLRKSIDAYQQAVQKDPNYALAYAGLASAYALLGQVPYDDLPPAEVRPKAKEAAQRAISLDPELAEPHAVLANLAFSYDWDFDAAEREFQRALALDPNDPTAHHLYGRYCIARNRLPQALEENSRTLELDPVSPLFNTIRAEISYHARNYDAALDQGHRTVEQYPNYPLTYIWLGSAYREKKMYAQALEQFTKCRQLSGDRPSTIALYGHALALSGDAAGARQALADLQHLSQSRYVSSLYFATIYLGLGENSKALDFLDRAYRERSDRLVYLGGDPIADPLRSDPRFQQLLQKIGIAPSR